MARLDGRFAAYILKNSSGWVGLVAILHDGTWEYESLSGGLHLKGRGFLSADAAYRAMKKADRGRLVRRLN